MATAHAFTPENFSARECYRPAYDGVAAALRATLEFDSLLDVGCGQGFLIDALLEHGKDAFGVELEPAAADQAGALARGRILIGDATSVVLREADVVACIEVAEHIAPGRSEALVRTLCAHARRAIYFTAATPYQPGVGHINCRPTFDWLWMFAQQGWALDFHKTAQIRNLLGVCTVAPWISMNTLLFTRQE